MRIDVNFPRLLCLPSFGDHRGSFCEVFNAHEWQVRGIEFVTDYCALSHRGVFRGYHYQTRYPQGKLVTVVRGAIMDICVDVRNNPDTFGATYCYQLDSKHCHQFWVPPGFAHGYLSLRKDTIVAYKATQYRHAESEVVISYSDVPGITLPRNTIVSAKDQTGIPLRDAPRVRIRR